MNEMLIELKKTPSLKRASLWLMCLAVIFIVALKPDRSGWEYFHLLGWPCMAVSLFLGWRLKESVWLKTLVLFAYVIVVLYFSRIDSDFSNSHLLEMGIFLVIGLLVVPAVLAKFWLKTPLKYRWLNGKWTWQMWLWIPVGFLIAIGAFWLYFNILTPNLYTSWPLVGGKDEALARIFWTCNLGGCWDELVWINFVFSLMMRHFSHWEANFAQAVFFTSFLYDVAFFGAGPLLLYPFALLQGYTYYKTGSLLYLIILHFIVDLVLFFMIANRWFPGSGM
jgi:hypothetical protein